MILAVLDRRLIQLYMVTVFINNTVDWPRFCRWLLRPMFIRSCIVSTESHNIRTPGMLSGSLTFKVN